MNQTFEWDVFLSHNSKDKASVRIIAERLREQKVKVWLDEWAIRPGDDIYAALEDGLQRSRVLALFMSPNAFDSGWVRLERGTAIFRDPENKLRRFLPLLLEDCDIPDTVRRFAYIDLRGGKDNFASLLEACTPPASVNGKGSGRASIRDIFTSVGELPAAGGAVRGIRLSSNGDRLLAMTADNSLVLWNLRDRTLSLSLPATEAGFNDFAFVTNNLFMTGGTEQCLRVWTLDGKQVASVPVDGKRVSSIQALNRPRLSALVVTDDRRFHLVSPVAQSGVYSSVGTGIATAKRQLMAASSNGAIIAAGDNVFKFIHTKFLIEPIITLHEDRITAVDISQDGQFILCGTESTSLYVIAAKTGRRVGIIEGHSDIPTRVQFHPSGNFALSWAGDNTSPAGYV